MDALSLVASPSVTSQDLSAAARSEFSTHGSSSLADVGASNDSFGDGHSEVASVDTDSVPYLTFIFNDNYKVC